MALDHALATTIGGSRGDGGARDHVDGSGGGGRVCAVLRLYGWARPTLSLGRNEPASAYPIETLRASGFDVVRRPTGGRAVLHGLELTYAVIAPLRALAGARSSYLRINQALADALRRLGAPAEVVGGERAGARALAPDAGPCFHVPAVGEVVARGRKIVGSAQARIGGALLQHGSILLDGDQGPLAGVSSAITLRELVGDVSIDEVAGAVAESLRVGLGGEWMTGHASPPELALADELEAERYASDSWTWRR
jgi:lipoate-protein ligase A